MTKRRRSSSRVSRRSAVKAAAGCGMMVNTPMLATMLNLQATKAMAAGNSGNTGYKALVCVFLAGANDSYNMFAPRETAEYDQYRIARSGLRNAGDPGVGGYNAGGGLALRDEDFTNTTVKEDETNGTGRDFGFHPSCAVEVDPADPTQSLTGPDRGIAQLYRDRKLAVLANVGALAYPITRTEYNNNTTNANGIPARPLGLFSHADLQRHWQTSVPQSRAQVTGWGGRLADLFRSFGHDNNGTISMNMSINGVNLYQTGTDVFPYTVGTGGADELNDYASTSTTYRDVVFRQMTDDILNQSYSDLLSQSFASTSRNSIDAATAFNAAVDTINITAPFDANGGGGSDLSARLKMVARIIGASNSNANGHNPALALNQTRQVFFVQEGGWDHHSGLIVNQHNKLQEVSKAMVSFNSALEELGVENDVITFTASDFARTLGSNGQGSDHAWGGNHLMMGGCVDGGKVFGSYPSDLLAPIDSTAGNLNLGRGRMIPTTSVDQFAADMAIWFGVDNQADLAEILPNIGEFYAHSAGNSPLGMII